MIIEKQDAQSCFVSYLSVKNSDKVNAELIEPLVKEFFSARAINKYTPVVANAEISDLDFRKVKVEFSYFYDYIINDIRKDNGNIDFSVKYCITLDKQNCSKKCELTKIYYDDILLNKKPIFYFIYIDIEDIFTFLRKMLDKNSG